VSSPSISISVDSLPNSIRPRKKCSVVSLPISNDTTNHTRKDSKNWKTKSTNGTYGLITRDTKIPSKNFSSTK